MRQLARRLACGVATLAIAAACGHGSTPKRGITPNTEGWWREQVFYEVFVRSFADSDGDGVGDLAGLTDHLDYLNDGNPATTTDLGVDAVWLMPIHPSPSYHGYDVTDYRSVNPQYGTEADFDAFVAAAHQRGIRVVIDMVLNHSSSQHPWFVDSRSSATSARRDWYVWQPSDPGWTSPTGGGSAWNLANGSWFYAAFNGSMPDLNLRTAAVETELVSTMKSWLARGVDGFRLDAVRYYVENGPDQWLVDQPESHDFLRRIRAALQADYPDALLVAEAWAPQWTTSSYYGAGDEAQLAFCFDLAGGMKSSAQGGTSAAVRSALQTAVSTLAGKDLGFMAPFLSNHDQTRVMKALGGVAPSARIAAATMMALPGTPFVYYGEELGMQGGTAGDPQKRTPMRWTATAPGYGFTTAAQSWCEANGTCAGVTELPGVDAASAQADTGSLWNLYRRLIGLRHAHPMLATGDALLPAVTGGGAGIFAVLRSTATRSVLFVANYAGTDSGAFTVAAAGAPVLMDGEGLPATPTSSAGVLTFAGLGPQGFAFISLE